ncbi:MAG: hypothetical protein OXQ28_11515 [Acidobacteriota bacterium]|nr:hypothetical protein [Acidobacteriota bacterium]
MFVEASPRVKERKARHWVLRRVVQLIAEEPGRTQLELTRAIYGPDLRHTRLNLQLGRLVKEGKLRREGVGGKADPFRYYPVIED